MMMFKEVDVEDVLYVIVFIACVCGFCI